MKPADKKIAIIGAGIAGLSCATALKNAGFEVTVFEKSRGVSGRLSTRIAEDWQCDHGAQYFTARDADFNTEVARWQNANVAKLWQPTLKVFDGNTFKVKDNATLRYVGYPHNNTPGKWLAKMLNVVTETTITSLFKHAGQWQLRSKEHGPYHTTFDVVILAIPAPQAAVILKGASKLADLCASVVMQPCFALMVQFTHSIKCNFDGLFIDAGLLTWAACNSAKPGRESNESNAQTWVLHASSQWSALHLESDTELIAQDMLAAFMQIVSLDTSLKSDVLASMTVQSYTLHRWLYADCEHYLTDIYQLDAEQKIGLCGDWLNGGKVQGAWLSGFNLANALIANNKPI